MLELLSTVFLMSATYNADPYLVAAVVNVESGFNPITVGTVGEIGLMQLRPEYHIKKGYSFMLFDPKVNLQQGIKYLKSVQSECRHKEKLTFLVCYNAGVAGGSKIKNPRSFDYYKKVTASYNAFKKENIFLKYQKNFFSQYSSSERLRQIRETAFLSSNERDSFLNSECLSLDQLLLYSERKRRHRFGAFLS